MCQKKACGKSADVREEDCIHCKECVLPGILEKYQERDIFNANETGLFFKCLPDKTLIFKNKKCHGGKMSKESHSLIGYNATNMDGSEKKKIFMIGKSRRSGDNCHFKMSLSSPYSHKSTRCYAPRRLCSKLNLMDCVEEIAKAWDINVKLQAIVNC